MKRKIIQSLLILISFYSFSQDVVVKKNGDEVKAKILEINTTEIKYKNFDYPDGPTYIISKADVFMIKYENGTKDVFKDEQPKQKNNNSYDDGYFPASKKSNNDLYKQGENDANKYYTKYTGPGTGSFFSGFCLGPVCGVIAPAIISGSEPKPQNLGYPDAVLFQDPTYRAGYISRASKIKRKKVWNNYLIGAIISTAANVIYFVSISSSK